MRLSKLFLKSFVLKIFASILYTLVNFNINTLQCSYLVPLLSLAVVLVSPAGQRQRASLPGRSPFALLPVYLWFVRPTSFTRVVPTTLNMLQVFCDQNGLHAHTRWFFSCGFGSCDQIWPHLQSHMITLTPPTLAIFASRASCTVQLAVKLPAERYSFSCQERWEIKTVGVYFAVWKISTIQSLVRLL